MGAKDIEGEHLQWSSWQPDLDPKRVASHPKPYEVWKGRRHTHHRLGLAELLAKG